MSVKTLSCSNTVRQTHLVCVSLKLSTHCLMTQKSSFTHCFLLCNSFSLFFSGVLFKVDNWQQQRHEVRTKAHSNFKASSRPNELWLKALVLQFLSHTLGIIDSLVDCSSLVIGKSLACSVRDVCSCESVCVCVPLFKWVPARFSRGV